MPGRKAVDRCTASQNSRHLERHGLGLLAKWTSAPDDEDPEDGDRAVMPDSIKIRELKKPDEEDTRCRKRSVLEGLAQYVEGRFAPLEYLSTDPTAVTMNCIISLTTQYVRAASRRSSA